MKAGLSSPGKHKGCSFIPTILPVLWVGTEQRRQHHHLIFASGDLGDRQDLVLGLRMTDVQHGGRASLVLFQRARCAISHLQGKIRSQLTFDVLRWHLDADGQREENKMRRQIVKRQKPKRLRGKKYLQSRSTHRVSTAS